MTPFETQLADIIEVTVPTVASACHPLTPPIDKNPKGLEAVVLSAVLRAYADVIELGFDEGNTMGPLKTAVDEVRARALQVFLGAK